MYQRSVGQMKGRHQLLTPAARFLHRMCSWHLWLTLHNRSRWTRRTCDWYSEKLVAELKATLFMILTSKREVNWERYLCEMQTGESERLGEDWAGINSWLSLSAISCLVLLLWGDTLLLFLDCACCLDRSLSTGISKDSAACWKYDNMFAIFCRKLSDIFYCYFLCDAAAQIFKYNI